MGPRALLADADYIEIPSNSFHVGNSALFVEVGTLGFDTRPVLKSGQTLHLTLTEMDTFLLERQSRVTTRFNAQVLC